MRVWVTGGYFDDSGECFVDEVDLATERRRRLLTFVPPPRLQVPTKGFTGARWLDRHTLLIASFCAIWRFDVRTWECTGALHQPDFNDLHDLHVDHREGRLYVCNTGLDAVEVFSLDGNFVGRHSLSPAWFDTARQDGLSVEREEHRRVLEVGWAQHQLPVLTPPRGDYYSALVARSFHQRPVRDYAHGNHVTAINGNLAVTMLATREIRCVRTFRTLATFDAPPHDGCHFDDLIWTSTTAGMIQGWSPNRETWRVVEEYDTSQSGHLGWCRGLLVSEFGIAAALTQMHRPPQFAWRAEGLERTETAVLWLERGSGRLLGRVNLSDPRGSKIFAVLTPEARVE